MKAGRITALLLSAALLLGGCTLLDGEYHSVTPYLPQDQQPNQEQTVCQTYSQVQKALVALVESGSAKGVIYVQNQAKDNVQDYMADAVSYVLEHNAIGAYAVDTITYAVGTNAAIPAVAVDISYIHSRSEILRIKQTRNMEQTRDVLLSALENFNSGVVIRVSQYQEWDLIQLIQDYVDNHPDTCMEQPHVSVNVYPEQGNDRVIEVTCTYQNSRDALRSMQEQVETVFASAELYVHGDGSNWEKYAQLYSFLMERFTYKLDTSITPAYSLLRYGVGDSKAFATVYSQMCRRAGLDCQTVAGTKAGEPWCWNVVCVEDVYYYIDLLSCKYSGAFSYRVAENMDGYVWDYSAFDSQTDGA